MNRKRHGKGAYVYKNNDKYVGDWENDVFEGVGIYLFDNGDYYYGDLSNG